MKKTFKPLLVASAVFISSVAMIIPSAHAQVAGGIAIADPEVAIATATALTNAYQQIDTQYKASIDQIRGRQTTVQALSKQLDTNNDNQLSEQEQQANPTVVSQIRAENAEMQKLLTPVTLAQMFALQQIAAQYPTAQQQVITSKNINVILSPQAILYGPQGINITKDIIARLNVLVPTANINVTQGWQPTRQTAGLHQQIQQLRAAAFQRSAQTAQTSQPAPAQQPSGR